jgi:zinc/manganese transport system substrate-binding protein
MWRSAGALTAVVLALGLAAASGAAAAEVRVVAATPDLKALTEAVGGDRVDVVSLVRGPQNAHDVEVRPSLMLKLRHADLLVRNGLGLDYWVEPLLIGAQNARIMPGAPGYVDASREVPIIPPKGPIDRSRGDVHPEGDPHYTLDPANADVVTANILEGLKRAAPQDSPLFEARRRDFLTRLDAAMADWRKTLAPFRGAKVVTYHDTFSYFLRRFNLELAGTIEDRPGIPPSPTHLADLARLIREQHIKVIVAEPYADRKAVELVARDSGARAVTLPAAVGGVRGVDTYLDLIEFNVRALAEALR